jgi:hypothetical protein
LKSTREYSDLSDKQKIVYIKRGVVMGIGFLIPLMITVGIFASVLNSYAPEQEPDYTNIPTINATALEQDAESLNEDDVRVIGLMFLFLGAIYGVSHVGMELGYYFADKLNLYTDFNLDGAEKHYNKVKNAVEKLEGSQPHDSVKRES